MLFGIPPSVTSNPNRQKVTAEQAEAIREWLRSCDLSWQACATVVDADQLERRLARVHAAAQPGLSRAVVGGNPHRGSMGQPHFALYRELRA
jgi:hypothetical protein